MARVKATKKEFKALKAKKKARDEKRAAKKGVEY